MKTTTKQTTNGYGFYVKKGADGKNMIIPDITGNLNNMKPTSTTIAVAKEIVRNLKDKTVGTTANM